MAIVFVCSEEWNEMCSILILSSSFIWKCHKDATKAEERRRRPSPKRQALLGKEKQLIKAEMINKTVQKELIMAWCWRNTANSQKSLVSTSEPEASAQNLGNLPWKQRASPSDINEDLVQSMINEGICVFFFLHYQFNESESFVKTGMGLEEGEGGRSVGTFEKWLWVW